MASSANLPPFPQPSAGPPPSIPMNTLLFLAPLSTGLTDSQQAMAQRYGWKLAA